MHLGLPTACLACCVSSTTASLLRLFLRTTAAMARKKINGDELGDRTKADGYRRGTHRDKDNLRDRNKHIDKVKKDQDVTLGRYVRYGSFVFPLERSVLMRNSSRHYEAVKEDALQVRLSFQRLLQSSRRRSDRLLAKSTLMPPNLSRPRCQP